MNHNKGFGGEKSINIIYHMDSFHLYKCIHPLFNFTNKRIRTLNSQILEVKSENMSAVVVLQPV